MAIASLLTAACSLTHQPANNPNTMNETKRFFLIGDLYDNAKASGANAQRLERLKAWEDHQAEAARAAMRTPFTIHELFTNFQPN